MLVHPRFPGFTASPQVEDPGAAGRPARTVIGDALKRFWQATKPPARVGAGLGASVLQRLVRGVLTVNLYVAASTGIAGLWTMGKLRTIVPLAILTVLMLVAKAVWNLVLLPFHHVALALVGVAAAIEGLLAGRVFVQLAYEENVGGLAGSVLGLTDPIVAPFSDLEGTALLHDTGVVEFATLTAMEAVLIATIGAVLLLMFWSEFLHMYRRIAEFFTARSESRQQSYPIEEPQLDAEPVMSAIETQAASADLSAAS
jgi:hypothetical protein